MNFIARAYPRSFVFKQLPAIVVYFSATFLAVAYEQYLPCCRNTLMSLCARCSNVSA